MFAQLFNAFNARSDLRSAFSHPSNNKWLWGAILFGVLAQVAVVELPLLQTAFGTASLDWAHWAIAAAMASAVLWVFQGMAVEGRPASRVVRPTKSVLGSRLYGPIGMASRTTTPSSGDSPRMAGRVECSASRRWGSIRR